MSVIGALRIAAIAVVFGFNTFSAHSTVLRVPVDYPTIQSALDALEIGGDTVLIETGEYAETLQAPSLSFWMIGNVEPDTGDFLRPVIDPSLLPNGLRAAALILPTGSGVSIENIRFRNRNAMSPFTTIGGIRYSASADSVIFRNCAFDTLYRGIIQPDSSLVWPEDSLQGFVVIENCAFRGDSSSGINMQNGALIANRCHFSGGSGLTGVWCGEGSQINQCTFQTSTYTLLSVIGRHNRISDCIFGPSGLHELPAVELVNYSGEVNNCIFTNLSLSTWVLSVEGRSAGSLTISDNIFVGNYTNYLQGRTGVVIEGNCDPSFPTLFVNNTVLACSTDFPPSGFTSRTCAEVRENRFALNRPPHRSVIQQDTSFNEVYTRNIFQDNGFAMRNTAFMTVEAFDNWWGDASGPRAAGNTGGLGDSVGANVLYDPWTTDTLDWISSTEEMPVIPAQFEMNIFPNPFNSSANLVLRVPEPIIARIELFDIMGRRVKVIWSGAIAVEKKIFFDANELPSGIYFARAVDVHFQRLLIAEKLVLLK